MELSIVPGQVQHLTLTHCPSLPSLILNWEAPANSLEAGNVLQYCIRITPVSSGDDDVADDDVADDDFADDDVADEDALPKEVVVEGDTTMLEFSNKDGLRPLHGYMFEVCAKSCRHVTGDWSKVEGFLGKWASLKRREGGVREGRKKNGKAGGGRRDEEIDWEWREMANEER